MKNKSFVIFIIMSIFGLICFTFAIATANGWHPTWHYQVPTTSVNVVESVKVIPQDLPQNIEVSDEVPAVPTINLPEMVIVVPAVSKNPGAARYRQVQPQSLKSPTGLASQEALNYQPGYKSHRVRTPKFRQPSTAYLQPIQQKRETIVFEVK